MDAIIYNEKLMELMQLSKNRFLIQSLTRKMNPGKLEYELKKCKAQRAERRVETPVKQVASKVDSGKRLVASAVESHSDQVIQKMNEESVAHRLKIIRNDREVKYEELPEKFKKLVDANRDAYKEIRSLHEKLKLMEKAKQKDRQPLTEKISKLDEQIRDNWKVIDAWEPGQEEEVKPKVEIDHKRINSNRKFISTNIKLLSTAKENKKAALREKLQLRVDELVAAGEELKEKTKEELKNSGIKI